MQKDILETLINKKYTVVNGELVSPRGKVLKCTITNAGYKKSTVYLNKKNRPFDLHRFVAYIKYGDAIFRENIVVRHLNGNRLDNTYENISIGSILENMDDCKRLGKKRGFNKKYNTNDIYNLHKKGFSYRQIMNTLNVSSVSTVGKIVRRLRLKESGGR